MSKRKTVKLNMGFALKRIKEVYRHNVAFCETMGRPNQKTWVSDWSRTPPKNLPSPQEAAKMCVLLQATPAELLTDEKDIALVQSLIDEQAASAPAPAQNDDLDYIFIPKEKRKAVELVMELTVEQTESIVNLCEAFLKARTAPQARS